MGNIEATRKCSKLKSISSIEDNYLQAGAGGVLLKKPFVKVLVLESIFNEVTGLHPCKFIE